MTSEKHNRAEIFIDDLLEWIEYQVGRDEYWRLGLVENYIRTNRHKWSSEAPIAKCRGGCPICEPERPETIELLYEPENNFHTPSDLAWKINEIINHINKEQL